MSIVSSLNRKMSQFLAVRLVILLSLHSNLKVIDCFRYLNTKTYVLLLRIKPHITNKEKK